MTTNDNPRTVGSILPWATLELSKAGILTARLDSFILMEDVLNKDRAHLLAHPELHLSKTQQNSLEELIEQRKEHIPLAYLRGKSMFYGRTFYVSRDTLIPRPESEDIVDLLKTVFDNMDRRITVADIGTGSGCLGLTAALEVKNCNVDLYDIDPNALNIAKKNAQELGVTARYFEENLLAEASSRMYDVILANLPYVPLDYDINQDATFEPKIALFAGSDGLDDYRVFWRQIKGFAKKPKYVLTESLPDLQHKELAMLAHNAGYRLEEFHDFVQLFALA